MLHRYAIAVIAYNREDTLDRLLNKLKNCKYYLDTVDIIIRIDKSENNLVTQIAEKFIWPYGEKKIQAAQERLGLKNNILGCGDLLNIYDAIAVFEDDIMPSEFFYDYMRKAVPYYENCDSVAGISLYSYRINQRVQRPFEPLSTKYDTFFIQHAVSWGQIWMKNAWRKFIQWLKENENNKFETNNMPIDICSWGDKSWLRYHVKYCIEENKYFVMPYESLSTNFHCSGEHSLEEQATYQVPLCRSEKEYLFMPFDKEALRYDVYFENMNLFKELGLNSNELTVDLYGIKKNHRRYWITNKLVNYKKICTYGQIEKPIDANVIDNVAGNFLFLYDTDVVEKNNMVKKDQMIVNFKYDVINFMSKKLIFKLYILSIKQSIKKNLRRYIK